MEEGIISSSILEACPPKRGRGRPRKQLQLQNHSALIMNAAGSNLDEFGISNAATKNSDSKEKRRNPVITTGRKSIRTKANKAKLEPTVVEPIRFSLASSKELVGIRSPNGFDRGLNVDEIVGATNDPGELFFFVKWHGVNEIELIHVSIANQKCPHAVNTFCEQHIFAK